MDAGGRLSTPASTPSGATDRGAAGHVQQKRTRSDDGRSRLALLRIAHRDVPVPPLRRTRHAVGAAIPPPRAATTSRGAALTTALRSPSTRPPLPCHLPVITDHEVVPKQPERAQPDQSGPPHYDLNAAAVGVRRGWGTRHPPRALAQATRLPDDHHRDRDSRGERRDHQQSQVRPGPVRSGSSRRPRRCRRRST